MKISLKSHFSNFFGNLNNSLLPFYFKCNTLKKIKKRKLFYFKHRVICVLFKRFHYSNLAFVRYIKKEFSFFIANKRNFLFYKRCKFFRVWLQIFKKARRKRYMLVIKFWAKVFRIIVGKQIGRSRVIYGDFFEYCM